jgi:acylphosphatase
VRIFPPDYLFSNHFTMESRTRLAARRARAAAGNRLTFFDMTSRRLRITGRVQGVGFRYAMQREAARLGVSGWVRNRLDGSVEAHLHGAVETVDALAGWARRGPPGAHVDAVEEAPAAEDAPQSGFELRPTV